MEAEISVEGQDTDDDDTQPSFSASAAPIETMNKNNNSESSTQNDIASQEKRAGELPGKQNYILAAVRPNFKPPTSAKAPLLFSLPVSSGKPAWMAKLQSRSSATRAPEQIVSHKSPMARPSDHLTNNKSPTYRHSRGLVAAEEKGNGDLPEWKKKLHQMKSTQMEKGVTIMDLEASFRKIQDDDDESIHSNTEDDLDSKGEPIPEWKKKLERMKSTQEEKGVSIMDLESSFRKSPGKSSAVSLNGDNDAPASPWKSPAKKSDELPEWKRKLMKKHQVEKYRESQALPTWKQKLLKKKEEEVKKYQSPKVEELPAWKQKLIAKKSATRSDEEDNDGKLLSSRESTGLMSVPFRDENQSAESDHGDDSQSFSVTVKQNGQLEEKEKIIEIKHSSDDDSDSTDSSRSAPLSPSKAFLPKDSSVRNSCDSFDHSDSSTSEERPFRNQSSTTELCSETAYSGGSIPLSPSKSLAPRDNSVRKFCASSDDSDSSSSEERPFHGSQSSTTELRSEPVNPIASISKDNNVRKLCVSSDDSDSSSSEERPFHGSQSRAAELRSEPVNPIASIPKDNSVRKLCASSDDSDSSSSEEQPFRNQSSTTELRSEAANSGGSIPLSPSKSLASKDNNARKFCASSDDSDSSSSEERPFRRSQSRATELRSEPSISNRSIPLSSSKSLAPRGNSVRKFCASSDDSDSSSSEERPAFKNKSQSSAAALRGTPNSITSNDSSSSHEPPSNQNTQTNSFGDGVDSTSNESDGGQRRTTPTRTISKSFDRDESERVGPTDLDEFFNDDFSVSSHDDSPIVNKPVKTVVFPSSPKSPKRSKSAKNKSPTKSPKKSPKKTKATDKSEKDQKEKKKSLDKKDSEKEKKRVKKEKRDGGDKPKEDEKEKKKKEEKSKTSEKEKKHKKEKEKKHTKEKEKKHRRDV